jgi:hypothetical protein
MVKPDVHIDVDIGKAREDLAQVDPLELIPVPIDVRVGGELALYHRKKRPESGLAM